MQSVSEKRKYQRCSNVICKISLSTDRRQWNEIDVEDISAGGIRFTSKDELSDKDLFFDVSIHNLLSEFNLMFEGVVVRKDEFQNNIYSAKFTNVNKYSQIQLDEVIESKISVAKYNQPKSDYDNGIYTFYFIPRIKPRRVNVYSK